MNSRSLLKTQPQSHPTESLGRRWRFTADPAAPQYASHVCPAEGSPANDADHESQCLKSSRRYPARGSSSGIGLGRHAFWICLATSQFQLAGAKTSPTHGSAPPSSTRYPRRPNPQTGKHQHHVTHGRRTVGSALSDKPPTVTPESKRHDDTHTTRQRIGARSNRTAIVGCVVGALGRLDAEGGVP